MSILRRSNFDKKLQQTLGVSSAEKKDNGVISNKIKEMNDEHLEQKEIMTPIITRVKNEGFRNLSCLLENPKQIENDEIDKNNDRYRNRYRDKNRENYNERIEEKQEEKIEETKFEMKEEDFPLLMQNTNEEKNEEKKEENKVRWNMKIDFENFKKIADDINNQTIQKINEEVANKKMKDKELMEQEMRAERLDDYIKKVKKSYEKDYLLYDIDDYMIDELANYVDEEDMTIDDLLYEEMLEEVKNREIEIDNDMVDSERYYTVYDEEAKYYEYIEY
jgi:hypothetical protein